MFTQYDCTVASHYVTALLYGDYSALTEQEQADLEQFEGQAVHGDAHGAEGHWLVIDNNPDNWAICEVSGDYAECAHVAYMANNQ